MIATGMGNVQVKGENIQTLVVEEGLVNNILAAKALTHKGKEIKLTRDAAFCRLGNQGPWEKLGPYSDELDAWVVTPDGKEATAEVRARSSTKVYRAYVPNVTFEHLAEAVAFMHQALGSPPESTFLSAVAYGRLTLPGGLTVKDIKSNPPRYIASDIGRASFPPQGATKRVLQRQMEEKLGVGKTPSETTQVDDEGENSVRVQVWARDELSSDQTGATAVESTRGNKYMAIFHFSKTGEIMAFPMKKKSDLTAVHRQVKSRCEERGITIERLKVDGEYSKEMRRLWTKDQVEVDIVPPNDHRTLPAERAIRTFKEHFISILAGTDPAFPAHEWDRLISQAELTMQLLLPAPGDDTMSRYELIHGKAYDFYKYPVLPIGSLVVVKDPDHASMGLRGLPVFYLGTPEGAPGQYRVFDPTGETERTVNNVRVSRKPSSGQAADAEYLSMCRELIQATKWLKESKALDEKARTLIDSFMENVYLKKIPPHMARSEGGKKRVTFEDETDRASSEGDRDRERKEGTIEIRHRPEYPGVVAHDNRQALYKVPSRRTARAKSNLDRGTKQLQARSEEIKLNKNKKRRARRMTQRAAEANQWELDLGGEGGAHEDQGHEQEGAAQDLGNALDPQDQMPEQEEAAGPQADLSEDEEDSLGHLPVDTSDEEDEASDDASDLMSLDNASDESR